MQLSQTQIQKLSQELRLTPQQILQSTILQLTTLALEARVNQELEQNPVLEELPPEEKETDEEPDQNKDEEEPIDWDEILPQNDDYEPKREYDHGREEYTPVQVSPRGMVDYLFDQLRLMNLSDKDEQIAREIIWNLDERGYLGTPIENIAFSQSVSIEQAEKVLKQIQQLEPPGIAARDLRECLLIQLRQMENTEDARLIVQDHFDDFANRRFQQIMKSLGWGKERIQAVQETIQKLNPKPGISLLGSDPQYIVPDLIVEKMGDDFLIEVNDSRIPELRISSGYLNMISEGDKLNTEARQYLKKKIDMAKWFIQAIHQRRLTMIKVMKAIIDRQRDFFEDYRNPLKPMILKDIAEDINMDISTISRVTNGKYVQLSSGVYELKYFFNEGMVDGSGEEVSTRIIKDKLKAIIEGEDKQKPYSDDHLAKLLKNEGYPIARRTVAKYREQLKIPVARLRRSI
ncbi:MAG: RNA polymerase factor sigma-54 [Candidatus Marinimicrobia bacterium]|nr:RNA polymerase factor sigma-54 [Candidatus Neomarinimicrobiota bacterium]RKY61359.1 MAG: RNA polymerase sigma-54 factor [Candidatus Neomarinimicrobiota bacterium]